jgi:hypothetical protein
MEHLGYPPPPYRDDGIDASRARQQRASKSAYSGGYAGKQSSFATSECNIDRRDWQQLSVEDFNTEYYDEGKPVILFGDGLVKLKDLAGET